mmetsp:Transcript_33992/g.73559  ORF Transcript_33992/g.73559 Transcript_33992/m.73559 type:complete len:250 (+) Transcript_33992:92-841(+)
MSLHARLAAPPLRSNRIAIWTKPPMPHNVPCHKLAPFLHLERLRLPRQHALPPRYTVPRHPPLPNVHVPRALQVPHENLRTNAQFEVQNGALGAIAGSVVSHDDGVGGIGIASQHVLRTLSVVGNKQGVYYAAATFHQYLLSVRQFWAAQVEVVVTAFALEGSEVHSIVRISILQQIVLPRKCVYLGEVNLPRHQSPKEFAVHLLGRAAQPIPNVAIIHRRHLPILDLRSVIVESLWNAEPAVNRVRRN